MQKKRTKYRVFFIAVTSLISAFALAIAAACSSSTSDSAERTWYQGISFILPDEWSAHEEDGILAINLKEEDGSRQTYSFKGLHYELTGDKSKQLDGIMKGILQGLAGSLDADNLNITADTIDGAATETVKTAISRQISDTGISISQNLVVFGAVAGDGATFLFFLTLGHDHDADIDKIIQSVRISQE